MNKNDLLAVLDITNEEFTTISRYRARMYSTESIEKRSGGLWTISCPDNRLKFIQRKLYSFLCDKYKPRKPVHGFVKGRSIKTNASEHIGRKYILNLDLKDFFGSISESRVRGLLQYIGFEFSAAEAAARICCLNNELPQGSPVSPLISNMLCLSMDRQMMSFCKYNQIRYTRYADDITFSVYSRARAMFDGDPPSYGLIPEDAINPTIRSIIMQNGFELNPDKVRYHGPLSRRIVTGLTVNEFPNINRKFIRDIRAILHKIEKHGISCTSSEYRGKYNGKGTLMQHLRGRISWIGQIKGESDPVFRRLAERFNKNFSFVKPIRIAPTQEEMRIRSIWVIEYCYDEDGEVKQCQGTAFFLEGVGLVTAHHVVEGGGREIEAFHHTKTSNKFAVGVRYADPDRDIAILDHSIPEEEYFSFQKSAATLYVGKNIQALGYPEFGPGSTLTSNPGSIISFSTKSGIRYVAVSQKLHQGMSGGPILDDTGRVLGLIHKGGPEMAHDLFIPLSEIENAIEDI